jgi:hypothetical protein
MNGHYRQSWNEQQNNLIRHLRVASITRWRKTSFMQQHALVHQDKALRLLRGSKSGMGFD